MNGATRPPILVGLIGAGIEASLSPAMHEREGDLQGFRYLYRKIDLNRLGLGVEALPDLLTAAERMGFRGLNITYPCKQAVIAHLDELSSAARRIGAVNTVLFDQGRRIGHNTDGSGFLKSFESGLPTVSRGRAVLLGAGGAGAAVAHALLAAGIKRLVVVDREPYKASGLADALAAAHSRDRVAASTDLERSLHEADGLVNATPSGMLSHPGLPLPAALLRSDLWVADIVYFPLDTALLQAARALGCSTLDGGGMAVFQAADAFAIFTDIEPDSKRMRTHFDSLARRADPITKK